jgi:hypothetical protein
VSADAAAEIHLCWYRPVPREQVPCPAFGERVAAIAAAALGLPSLAIIWCEPCRSYEGAIDLRLNRMARMFDQPAPPEVEDPFYACQEPGRALRGQARRGLALAEAPAVYIVAGKYCWNLAATIGHEATHVHQYRAGFLREGVAQDAVDLAESFADRGGAVIANAWLESLETNREHRQLELAYIEQCGAWLKARRDRGVPCQ